MRSQQTTSKAASAQDLGGAEVQLERVRTGIVQAADGGRFLLGVVATARESGEAAARAVEQIFQTAATSESANLLAALHRGMEIASQGLMHQTDQVAAVAVAIRRNRVYFVSAGDNVVFRVAGSEAIRLSEANPALLGSAEVPRFQTGPQAGLELQRGDRIVLASGGIFKANPSDDRPFVDPREIPEHIKNLPPEDAAKHLVSIALGRDVQGSATVAVLGEAKERRIFTRIALAGSGAIVLTFLAIIAAAILRSGDQEPVTDFGYAVLVRGGVLVDNGDGSPVLAGNLDTIPAGAVVSAQTDAAVNLQSTHQDSREITLGTIYLAQDSHIRLTEIDAHSDTGGSETTIMEMDNGSILVARQSGTWEYQVESLTDLAVLSGAGPGVLGIATIEGSVQVDCLVGVCRVEAAGDELLLSAGERVVISAGLGVPQEAPIPEGGYAQWSALCGGCVP